MDLFSAIYEVKNLNEYITVTEEYANRSYSNLKVPLNTATVLALKKVRSIEIEFFNKRDENGLACTLLQNLLCIPPSKVWGLLAKELIHLLQYWLEAIRKHLINHSTSWWMFLSLLLKFIKDIYLKDSGIPDLLVEFTAECLFDLATAVKPDVYQRHEILHCLNMVCAASSREVRFAFRTKFAECFVKLASGISTSGFLPYQYSALECLLRWLVPRQERSLRALSLDKWFPRDLCPDAARALFLKSTWMNFLQDARDFLNALNEGNGLLTSVICRHLTIGQIVVINGTEKQNIWMDLNTSVKCVSVLLDPRELEVFGLKGHRACEALLINDDVTDSAVLRRESLGLTISLDLHRAPSIRPNEVNISGTRVTIIVSSRTDVRALDRALRTTFGDKYQLLLDLDIEVSQSPQVSSGKINTGNYSGEDSRFSHPAEVKKPKRAGYIVRPKCWEGSSPSTSTSSILHLKNKLAALPRFPRFDKDPVHVIAEPSLSKVTECPELANCGAKSYISQRNACAKLHTEVKARSDGESPKPRNRGGRRVLSPVASDDNAATVWPTGLYHTDIETVEILSKGYSGENIVDALSREAMLAVPPKENGGVNTDNKKSVEESEAIDDTPKEIREARNRVPYKLPCHISTTDDESNTEAINETPAILCRKKSAVRGRNKPTPNIEEKQTFDVKTVEDFFSQHVAENQRGEVVISPRLAKKINETSSETSENFLDNELLLNEEIHTDIEQRISDDVAIIDCLNEMIDTVCRDFDNYTENIFQENIIEIMASIDLEDNVNMSNVKDVAKPKQTPKAKNIKLKYKKPKPRATKKRKVVQQKITKKMSTIIEQKDEEMNQELENEQVEVVKIISPKIAVTPKNKNKETPGLRRKRKLYSPKDDAIDEDAVQCNEQKTSEDEPLSKITKKDKTKTQATAACYKEIENERKKYTRLPRTRKLKGKFTEPPSPRSAKMNTAFDSLKESNESNEIIKLANKGDKFYNFSSDSEDEDFKKKKIEIKKRLSVESKAKGKNTRRGKGSDTSYEETNKTKPVKRKAVTKRTGKQKAVEKNPVVDSVKKDLVDEKMREAVRETLNTSIVVEPPENLEPDELKPTLVQSPQMEYIIESEANDAVVTKKRTKKIERKQNIKSNDISTEKNIKKTQLEIHESTSNDTSIAKKNENKKTKKNKAVVKKGKDAEKVKTLVVSDNDERTSSPLPGLLVEESKPKCIDDINDSLDTNMLQKFRKVFRDGPEANDSVLTQNMLSDVDKLNSSAQNYNCLQGEKCFADYDKGEITVEKPNTNVIPTKSNIKVAQKNTTANRSFEETILIDDLASEYDRQTDKSIATDGITAHFDEDEVPPATESLVETFQPRELQDLSQAMKKYFTELTREIYNSSKSSVESNKSAKGTSEVDNKSVRSPLVSVKPLSLDDISKWMPSRRSSDTDSPHASSKIISDKKISETLSSAESSLENTPRVKTNTAAISKRVNTRSGNIAKPEIVIRKIVNPKSPKADLVQLKSPRIALARISQEDFNKWLPPLPTPEDCSPKAPTRELKLIYTTRSKSKVNKKEIRNETQRAKSKTKTAEVPKPVETIFQIRANDSDDVETNTSSTITRSRRIPKEASRNLIYSDTEQTKPKQPRNKEQIKRNIKPATPKTAVRKSIISPIKLLGDFTPILDAGNSSVDENVPNLRSTNVLSKSKRKVLADSVSRETSMPETPKMRKRKCQSPILSVPKKRSVELRSFEKIKLKTKPKIEPLRLFEDSIDVVEDVTFARSGPSSSSVNDWLKRTDPAVKDPTLSLKDTIQNVMERLNTTLVEINNNTSKKFVNLFVEAQTELDSMSGQLSKCLSMVESFKAKFKKQALELMREDCQQRRAMVVLLKDDVQAVLNHMGAESN